MIKTAKKYIEAGLSVLPVRENKAPALHEWTPYETRRASDNEIKTMFTGANVFGIAVICGSISGGLEVLDFDSGGAVFPDWKEKIPPELFRKLTVEKSPHGYHVYFRSNAVEGSAKLANAENNSVLIETRGTGGYCICAPTPGYSLIQGSMLDVQTITPAEREKLMEAAREFNQVKRQRPKRTAPGSGAFQDFSPADYFSTNGDIRAILERNGWKFDRIAADGNERWTRPGKQRGTGGTLKENESGVLLFYPFTTSTEFEANQGYNAFQVLSILEYGGNQSDAARAIREAINQERPAPVPMKQRAPVNQYRRREPPAVPGSGVVPEIEIDVTDTSGEMEPHRDRESFIPFPLEALPLITRNFVIATARALNVDPSIVAVATLNTAGAAIGARLKLRLGGYNWTAAPVLWTALIGASSMGKTPAMKAPLELLGDKIRELSRKYADEMDNYKRNYSFHQRVLGKIEKCNDKAIDKEEEGDEEAAEELRQKAARLEKSQYFKPPKKPAERILNISGDFRLPGLIAIAAENPMGFQLHFDELTQLFTSLSSSSERTAASQEMLKFFDGTASRTAYKTAEKNRLAPQCWASILGGGVPSILQSYLKGTQYERDGLLSRFCLVWAPPVPPEQFNTAETAEQPKKLMKKVLETLVDFRPDYYPEIVIDLNSDGSAGDSIERPGTDQTDEDEKKDPHIEEMYRRPKSRLVNFSHEAMEEFKKKRVDLYGEKYNSNQDAKISLLGKSDGVLGRVALILHVLGAAEKFIDETQREIYFKFGLEIYTETHDLSLETFRRAEQITEWLVKETETVYKKLGILADDNDLSFIVDRLKKCPDGASTATIQYWKSRWRENGKPQLERLLTIGIKKGLLTATVQTGGNNRPCTIYKAAEK